MDIVLIDVSLQVLSAQYIVQLSENREGKQKRSFIESQFESFTWL